jgi:hypothetical protein
MMDAINYFEATGGMRKVALMSFLVVPGFLGLPAYQALVDPSGGYALPHDSFASDQFDANVQYVVCQTKVYRSTTKESPNKIDGCIADVRMSEFISPSHVVGAMEVLPTGEGLLAHERTAFCMGAALAAKHEIATNNLPSQELPGTYPNTSSNGTIRSIVHAFIHAKC